jgi:3-phenylpropionate/trans-cinnamate dioxygenase ferredoxin reductase subunit
LSEETFVIVGAGLGGATAAATLRTEGFEGRIVLVGDEPHIPYSKPPLSKTILRSEVPTEKSWLRPAGWYDAQRVELRLGSPATAIDPRTRAVELADGERVAYDKLLLVTGGSPRVVDVPGADLEGILTLRTLDDSLAIREHLEPGAPVVVIGAGFIGAEVAASARMLGCEVTVLEIADIPMGRALGPRLGPVYADLHRERGVDLRTGVGVAHFEGNHRVERVVATDDHVYATRIVVVGVGLDPDVGLATRAGLEVGNGVLVDEYCRTSIGDVFAAGDLANHPNPYVGRRIRIEHWQNAQHQGAAAARNMLGRNVPFREVPWVWSDQYEHNLQMIGLPDPAHEEVVVRGSLDDRSFCAFFLRSDGRVSAALAVDRAEDVRSARSIIQNEVVPDRRQLVDVDTDLASLTTAR